jgi:hypothetical protein
VVFLIDDARRELRDVEATRATLTTLDAVDFPRELEAPERAIAINKKNEKARVYQLTTSLARGLYRDREGHATASLPPHGRHALQSRRKNKGEVVGMLKLQHG